jgi:excisionase family DNA binding protein
VLRVNNRLLTIIELMEVLKVSRGTINNWRKKGMPYLKGEKSVRFNESDVMEWLNAKK